MANYFVINNKFRPYSFDELIKPYQMYGQAYKEQEALIDAAREKEFSPDYLDQNLDKSAYDMYNTANQQLQAASDELATNGLSADLRRRIKSSARDYKRTMDALNEAQARLYTERDRRAKLGNDYVYQQDNIRIGDFLNGASPNQNSVKLSDITSDIAAEFSKRASEITQATWDKVFSNNGKVISGYYDVTTKQGLTDAQLNSILALANPETWNTYVDNNRTITDQQKQELQGFINDINSKLYSIGYDKYQQSEKDEIWDAVVKGAHAGLDSTTHEYKQDRTFISPELQYRMNRDKIEDEKFEEDRKIARGELPFFEDPKTGEKWYTNDKAKVIWSIDSEGNIKTASNIGKQDTKDDEAARKAYNKAAQDFPLYAEDTGLFWLTSNDSKSMKFVKDLGAEFNLSDQEPVKIKELGILREEALRRKLAEYNLTEDDIIIYKDKDIFGYDDFKIVLKDNNTRDSSSEKDTKDLKEEKEGREEFGEGTLITEFPGIPE